MIKFSIIINTHNQDKFIYEAINSCLKQSYQNFELIVLSTSNKKIQIQKFLKYKKKIKFIHKKPKFKQPELNQMDKIYKGFKSSKGEYILFLDGDDKFHKDKLKKLKEISKRYKIYCNQDLPLIFSKNFQKLLSIKSYKYNFFSKFLFNDWPQIYGTSSIFINKKILKKFFSETNPFSWKMLAIDAQIIFFCRKFYQQTNYLSGLTLKRLHDNNLGESYLNIFKKKFWTRRYMQFDYVKSLGGKQSFNCDYYITKIIYFFLRNL